MAKIWSDRFEEGLNPFIESFNASIKFDFLLLEEDLDGSVAHARMLGRTGIITSEEAEQLEYGLEKIRMEVSQGFCKPDDLSDEDVHMFVDSLIAVGSYMNFLNLAYSLVIKKDHCFHPAL